MRTPILLFVSFLVVTACGKKAAPTPASAPTAPKIQMTAEMPSGPDAKAFALKLLKTEISGFNPTGSSEFTYTSMTFTGDGKWEAKGTLELGGETIDCTENGTWRIDAMDSTNAVMDWELIKTNCPSRDAGAVQRLNMGILKDGTHKISFR